MKVYCNKLNVHTKNLKAVTKITKQNVIANKSTNEIKWDHKKYLINPKEGRKREE